MLTAQLRQHFLDYFKRQDHTIVPSASLVPVNDPTLLFTNAGMVPFKDVFIGRELPGFTRATSVQRCMRAGGKHNDLENVGYTARHHTFFEMLGNFSFGDYFKREAIIYAWQYLTQELGIDKHRLWITVYADDEESSRIWQDQIGVSADRISHIATDDNFWTMGETGPCGPCSEIFFDHGSEFFGDPPGGVNADADRYVEIWNLVFMQYERDGSGVLNPLPHPSVDTGMGLERLAAVMQGVHDNYSIDLFQRLMAEIATLARRPLDFDPSLKVIADHLRACAFLMTDGIVPGNEGRGYVLRRIIRRALRHGYKLGLHDPFLFRLIPLISDEMGAAYPELRKNTRLAQTLLQQEELRFAATLEQGMRVLENALQHCHEAKLEGELIFQLYDTYGFPPDMTADVAREHHIGADLEGFEAAMARQRQRARSANRFVRQVDRSDFESLPDTRFCGYEIGECSAAILDLRNEAQQAVESLAYGQKGVIILDQTPFYAESGGQAADHGEIIALEGCFHVHAVNKVGSVFAHAGSVTMGAIGMRQCVQARIDGQRRAGLKRHHSATHLLHAALRSVLGDHVVQKGSLVEPERLRFDFAHYSPLTGEEKARIEDRVNAWIQEDVLVQTELMDYTQALASGALALFGEKYTEQVRVLRMGDHSVELCGGTHVSRSGEIGILLLVHEVGIAAGVRRVEAVVAEAALKQVRLLQGQISEAESLLKAGREQWLEHLKRTLEHQRELERRIERMNIQLTGRQALELAAQSQRMGEVNILCARVPDADAKSLRPLLDELRNRLGTSVIVLGAESNGKASLAATVSSDLSRRCPANELIQSIAPAINGRGGGKPDLAQAGGTNPSGIPEALQQVESWLSKKLNP